MCRLCVGLFSCILAGCSVQPGGEGDGGSSTVFRTCRDAKNTYVGQFMENAADLSKPAQSEVRGTCLYVDPFEQATWSVDRTTGEIQPFYDTVYPIGFSSTDCSGDAHAICYFTCMTGMTFETTDGLVRVVTDPRGLGFDSTASVKPDTQPLSCNSYPISTPGFQTAGLSFTTVVEKPTVIFTGPLQLEH